MFEMHVKCLKCVHSSQSQGEPNRLNEFFSPFLWLYICLQIKYTQSVCVCVNLQSHFE